MSDNIHGVIAGLQTSFPIAMLMAGLLAVSFFSVIELTVWTLSTFQRWKGLYFWSLIVATWGIAFNSLGYTLKFFQVTTANLFSVTLIIIGWICMVTGQSVVLYSRLHLVLHNHKKLRCVLIVIISNFFACHVPVTALVYGVNSSNPSPFLRPYDIYERVQLTIFACQEALISGLYIYYARGFLHTARHSRYQPRNTLMFQLIYLNLILMALDVALLGLQYTGFYEIQTSLKPAIYSLKLKLEFKVLNNLLRSTEDQSQNLEAYTGSNSIPP
ncbi:uncharacterized protein EKO05_0000645 [Ascochyta rabiei]|uniref:DUF7703 domain-containing protein n=1 Tax=Didymella rabiei TaxID=5454 RepID=A0A163HLP6_DIDRA|nr:uncharacterized protein EKO05_0000645 [Ascochyta rabiei]KZM25354.1 hypothetical protein ST47_g3566 [Ascochyta rabiei]UPX09969.1 hypothetical protein EKO05_0000645 [Ascochyta rabiei]